MTRAKALNKHLGKAYIVSIVGMQKMQNDNKELIHQIYDDFESRTCMNCKHADKSGKKCRLLDSWNMKYCSEFKPKE